MSSTAPPQFPNNVYSGPPSNYPSSSTWVQNFDDLYNANKQSMFNNGDNGPDVGNVYNAIVAASEIGVDPRIILAIMMQESHGYVGNGGTTDENESFYQAALEMFPEFKENQTTGGLMQCTGSPYFTGEQSPQVTAQNVADMINAGTNHFRSNLTNDAGLPTGQWNDGLIYVALRFYNSGSCDWSNLNNIDFNGTLAGFGPYVSDIANRLQDQVN